MGDDGIDPETGKISEAAMERSCEQLLASVPLHSYTLVVRAGEKGCYVARNGGRKHSHSTQDLNVPKPSGKVYIRGGLRPDTDMEALFAGLLQDDTGVIVREEIDVDAGTAKWIPAVHQQVDVVDPTGGGNTFLGGLAAALTRGKTVEEATVWGSVAASFAIEQVGVPTLTRNEEDHELWNGV
ncbi:Protein MAK32 [Colletotrichum spinosum]|uniref:Protein MAK32 n=1 Tax=Colletotrichum spinosum TaxID=1347390 RepID=A0A4R8PWT6_9PEZI|nr:Protein MAK32 [Colletotrichum spinosum]